MRQRAEIGEVHQPDRATADLVLVGRADAAPRGADRGRRVGRLPQRIEFAMQGEDQRDVLGDAKIFRADRDALPLQLRHLIEERLRIEHDAIADHGELRWPKHAGRQQRQLVGLAVDDKRVACIVAALETHDDIGLLRQPVDDLALPLVAPLGADDDNVGHFASIPSATNLCSSMICSKDRSPPSDHIRGHAFRGHAFPDHAPSLNHGRGRSHARHTIG